MRFCCEDLKTHHFEDLNIDEGILLINICAIAWAGMDLIHLVEDMDQRPVFWECLGFYTIQIIH
jgi:hypothetical protein